MSQEDRFEGIERILEEVREALTWTEESREINELKALHLLLEVTRSIHSTHDVHELIALILDSMIAFADADRAFLILIDEDGSLRFKMGRTRRQDYIPQEEFRPSTGVIEKTLEKRRPVIVPDALADALLKKRQSVQELKLRTVMCAPMVIKQKPTPIGLLYADSQRSVGRYSAAHLSVIASLADQAAVAVQNAQKFDTQG
jgi:GAF domain-containing protein